MTIGAYGEISRHKPNLNEQIMQYLKENLSVNVKKERNIYYDYGSDKEWYNLEVEILLEKVVISSSSIEIEQ